MPKSVANVKTTSKDMFADELKKFSQIFPQFVSEGKIDFDALKAFLADKNALADDKDKYTFTWAGKKQSFQAVSRPSHATLKPKIDESVDFDNTQNLFIEGDNLEVLKLLQTYYHGKIKMIYIDPPYNTGKDFIYKDNFTEDKSDYFERIGTTENAVKLETNSDAHGRYHSQWLSMMYPRLFLAKQLLREDGVIFISIDDNEQHHLKMLMNEVFGEGNFEGHIHWRRRHNQPNDPNKLIAIVAEHIFTYSKNSKKLKKSGVGKLELTGKFSNPDNDTRGDWNSKPWKIGSNQNGSKYKITTPSGKILSEEWMGEKKTYQELLKDKRIYFSDNGNGLPRKKIFKLERELEGQSATNWFKHEFFGSNQSASIENAELFNGIKNIFDNPKPTKLLKSIIRLGNIGKNDIILDFFAGSATTGHAVMDLNKQDDGKRKFILVQIPEAVDEASEAFKAGYQNIAEIGKERLRRAIKKHDFKAGFKVFSLAHTNYNTLKPYDGDDAKVLLEQEKLFTQKPLVDDFKPIDLVYEIILKQGFSLNANIQHKDDFYLIEDAELDRKLVITLQNPINTEQIEALKLTTDDILVCLDSALTDTQKVNFLRNFNLSVI